MTLRCRPADHETFRRRLLDSMHIDRLNVGYLRITTPPGADEFDGHFLVELATCEDVESGKALDIAVENLGRRDDLRCSDDLIVRATVEAIKCTMRDQEDPWDWWGGAR